MCEMKSVWCGGAEREREIRRTKGGEGGEVEGRLIYVSRDNRKVKGYSGALEGGDTEKDGGRRCERKRSSSVCRLRVGVDRM